MPALIRIGLFGTMFYAMLVMRQPCAEGVGRFIGAFEPEPDAGPTLPGSYEGFELLTAEEALKRWPDRPDGGLGDGGPDRDTDDSGPDD